jgi:hypothetical protein
MGCRWSGLILILKRGSVAVLLTKVNNIRTIYNKAICDLQILSGPPSGGWCGGVLHGVYRDFKKVLLNVLW